MRSPNGGKKIGGQAGLLPTTPGHRPTPTFGPMNGEKASLYAWLLIAVVMVVGLFIWRNSKTK